MKRANKKGQQMTLSTIIAIVLGIAVLVFLIFGFSTGWNNLWSKITGFTSDANVQDKIRDCETDCKLNEISAYCNQNKELRFFDTAGKVVKVTETCNQFANITFEDDEKKITPGMIRKMGFSGCPSITCPSPTTTPESDK